MAQFLPVSPIAPAATSRAEEAGIVQINLSAATGEIVTGAEFGLSTSMGDSSHDYLPYADPSFQAVADKYPTDLLRHNWELNTMMDIIFPSRSSAATPNFSDIDNYLKQQSSLAGFFNNNTATQIVTLGFPSWLDISNPADEQLYASLVVQVAQHFAAMGEPMTNFELVNEPDGHYSVTDLANTFNVVAEALHAVSPNYKLGGLTESWFNSSDYQTFFNIAGPNIGFVSWHQYVTGDATSKSAQQEVDDAMSVGAPFAQQVRSMMQAAGVPDSVPMFLGEYNIDGGDYFDPNNGNMVGAIAAAATTYAMIASNTNFTMGALWETLNDGSYGVFGWQGGYAADPVEVVLSDLTDYMPGNIVQTTMPSNTPGLFGYTTTYNGGFSVALIDTDLSSGYTVDLSKDGLPADGLREVIVSPANPNGITQSITNLSAINIAAGSLVIITNEVSHGGTLYSGSSSGSSGGGTTVPTNDYITPGSGSFTDAAGNTYTINAAGNADENGSPIPGGAGTAAMEQYDGTVYGEDAGSKQWYTWNQTAWVAATAPPSLTPSPNGTKVTSTSASPTIDQNGNAWSLVQSASNGLQIAVNGIVDAPTANVVLLETLNGAMVQENSSGNWYSETAPNDSWTQIANPNPTTPPPAPATVTGSGSDTLVLSISEDAYANGDGTSDANGDAAFTVSVDGKQLAGTFYATASHSASASQNFTLKGDWAPGTHTVTAAFLNDAWGGTASTDRNLYVNDVTYDGTDTKQSAALMSTGSQTFSVTDSTAIPPVVTGGGSDSLVVKVSEDYYRANAQFTVSVDGKQLGGTFTATTLHASGNSQTFAFAGDFGSGQHTVSVNFLNDAYAGTPATDRNLYVNDIVYNGTDTGQSAALMGQGAKTFSVSGGTTPSVSETGDHGSLARNLSQTGSYTVGGDTFVLGSGNAATVTLGTGTSQIKFVGPSSVTLTGAAGHATVTADAGNNKFVAGAGSLDVTGGAGKDAYVFHSTSGLLTLEDFSLAKGDTLTIDKALQGSLHEASDGTGGTMLTFGTNTSHGVDLHGVAIMPSANIAWA